MRGLGMTNIDAVLNLEWPEPADASDDARTAAELYDGIYNRFFLSGVFNKSYPENVLEGLEPHLPNKWQDDFDTISEPVNWCGLNYYTRKLIARANAPWPAVKDFPGPLPKTQMGWEIDPTALSWFQILVAQDYVEKLARMTH